MALTSEEIYEVLKSVIGEIEPVADASIDEKRYSNLEKYIHVFRMMHKDIDEIAYKYKDSQYSSANKIGELAKRQIEDMGIVK